MVSARADCRTKYWNPPESRMAYVRAIPARPGSIVEEVATAPRAAKLSTLKLSMSRRKPIHRLAMSQENQARPYLSRACTNSFLSRASPLNARIVMSPRSCAAKAAKSGDLLIDSRRLSSREERRKRLLRNMNATRSGRDKMAIHGIAMQTTMKAARDVNESWMTSNRTTGSSSSTCPRSELNLFRILPRGFIWKKSMGERNAAMKLVSWRREAPRRLTS
mmetsp:Transcript_20160/g.28123  ORF Transcript_20160/g.28123 Transcript_20160/m.28123 type:complete len:220 (-) Transcript_20160:1359-2018(-)